MDKKVTREVRKSRTIYKSRYKKRKQSFNPKTAETDDGGASTSARKLKSQDEYHVPKTDIVDYRIINFASSLRKLCFRETFFFRDISVIVLRIV